MLSRENDNTIHSGNYEEYFILYMDHELNQEQMKAVDEFLVKHPEYKSEFDLLISTKLPQDDIKLEHKELLMSDLINPVPVEEELLLLLDNELPVENHKKLVQKISEDMALQQQYSILLKTRLDASEQIIYPDKEELYHKTERVISLNVWMRVAAVILLIASPGIIYWSANNGSHISPAPATAIKKQPDRTIPVEAIKPEEKLLTKTEKVKKENAPIHVVINKKANPEKPVIRQQEEQQVAFERDNNENQQEFINTNRTASINENVLSSSTTSIIVVKPGINKSPVTSLLPQRTISIEPVTQPEQIKNSLAGNDRKGSLKGLLRKATRMIEKRTGINPANENDELLIGAVAVKLN